MRNSTNSKRKMLYESIMSDVSKLVKKQLNEMSDALLNRAAQKAFDLGQPERAQQFIDYKLDKDRIKRTYGTVQYSLEDIEELVQDGNMCCFVDVPTRGFKIVPVSRKKFTCEILRSDGHWDKYRGYLPISSIIDLLNNYLDRNNIQEEPNFYICH